MKYTKIKDSLNGFNNLNDEFDFFKHHSSQVQAPDKISKYILKSVEYELNPRVWIIFCKIGLLQFFSGILTLFLCSQLGVQFELYNFKISYNLYHYFYNSLGEFGCAIACGVIFMTGGAILSALLLKKQEIKRILNQSIFIFLIMSFGLFLCLLLIGAKTYLLLSFGWILGGTLGASCGFEITKWARFYLMVNDK